MRIERQNTCGIILAGGAGRRVQGFDKGFIKYDGKPLIEHVVQRLKPQVGRIIISANRNINDYKRFADDVVIDEVINDHSPKHQGPIAGICAGLKTLLQRDNVNNVLICSCDTPRLPHDLFERLRGAIGKEVIAVASDGHRMQNLHCLIKREAWPNLINFFDDGGRAMHRWLKHNSLIEVDFSDQADAFLNINALSQTSA